MRAIMVMFDSLNKKMLSAYGCKDTITPNFTRLAQKCVTFDNCYAGSLPCMPARREIHTGRYNFLHRSWGPLEPYDDSMPEILSQHGIYTHITTDHWHYWEEGGALYLNKYNSFEFVRGQEGDPWKGHVKFDVPEHIDGRRDTGRQEYINRIYETPEENQALVKNTSNGLHFLETNHDEDNWFLTIENFDPHEPFFSQPEYLKKYEDHYDGTPFDWPQYHPVRETREEIDHCVNEYRAIVTMCDKYLGKVMDVMDKYDMWKDTMLIVNTDHGFLLGEHGWWGKVMMPYFNEIAQIPLFIWDPTSEKSGERRETLVQTIDIAPTVLEYFGITVPESMMGHSLQETIRSDKKIRDYALFGQHGVHVNITDGRYVYMRCPEKGQESNIYNYLIQASTYPGCVRVEEMRDAELVEGFNFMKGSKCLKIHGGYGIPSLGFPPQDLLDYGTLLYDLKEDPEQKNPISAPEVEHRLKVAMVNLMKENVSPAEQYDRLGLQDILHEVEKSALQGD